MLIYLKYIVTWLFFMLLIVGITILVPKIAPKIDKWRAAKKAQRNTQGQKQESLLRPISQEEIDEANSNYETDTTDIDKQ